MSPWQGASDEPDKNASRPVKPSWRGKRAAPPSIRGTTGIWQDRSQGAIKQAFFKWGLKLVGIGTLLVLLLVAWIWSHFIPIKTPLIVITLTRYNRPVPPNTGALEDRNLIRDTWPSGTSQTWWRDAGMRPIIVEDNWSDPAQALRSLKNRLKQTSVGGPHQDSVVVYLSGHGLLDKDGDPSIILESAGNNHGIDQLDPWPQLKVRDVLKVIVDEYPERIRKIVLLDCTRIDSRWSIGVIRNGFAGRLPDVVEQLGHEQLYVLNSTSAGQKAWTSSENGGSIFGQSVVEALAGGADRKRPDGKISLREMSSFVHDRVSSWVAQRCHDVQEPQLIPEISAKEDFDIAWSEGTSTDITNSPSTSPAIAMDIPKLKGLWELHAELAPAMASSRIHAKLNLLSWEAFQQGLVYYEELLLAGIAYREDAAELSERLKALGSALDTSRRMEQLPQFRLGLTNQQIWQQYEVLASDRKLVEQRIEQPPKEPMPLTVPNESIRLVALDWAQRNARFADLPAIQSLLGLAPDDLTVEGQFLRLMTHPHGLTELARANPQALRDGVAVRLAAERAAAISGDERTLAAVRHAIDAADAVRREAEDRFFTGDSQMLVEATQKWRVAEQSYGVAATQAKLVQEMFVERDQCWSELSYLARWLDRRALVGEQSESITSQYPGVIELIEDCHRFGIALDAWLKFCDGADRPSEVDASLKELHQRVKNGRHRLRQAFDGEVGRLGIDGTSPKTIRKILDVLSTPLVSGSTRLGLWETVNNASKNQQTPNSAVSTSKSETLSRESLPRSWGWPEKSHPLEKLFDERYFNEELDIDESNKVPSSPDAHTARAESTPAQIASQLRDLARQEARVREKLIHHMDSLKSPATNNRSDQLAWVRRIDRQYRSLWPLVTKPVIYAEPEKSIDNPFKMRVRLEWQDYGVWQASRYLEDFWGFSDDGNAEPYFARIAGPLLDTCRSLGTAHPGITALQERLRHQLQAAEKLFAVEASPVLGTESASDVSTTVNVTLADNVPQGLAGLWIADPRGTPTQLSTKPQNTLREREPIRLVDKTPSRGLINFKFVKDAPPGKWQANIRYRGHQSTGLFDFYQQERGIPIVLQREAPKPSKMFVSGAVDKPGTIVFVLDCSASMANSAGSNVTRMARAREALIDLLSEVVQVGGYDTSLWFYGHRLGNNKDGSVARQKGWLIPDDVTRGADVERVWPRDQQTAPLDVNAFETEIKPMIQRAEAHGETPLYLAIQRAIVENLAQPKQRMAPRRLIVITDGANDQSDNTTPVSAITTAFAEDNKNIVKDQLRIQLDVIGFGVGQGIDAADRQRQLAGLNELRTAINSPTVQGTYHDAIDHKELYETLRGLLDRYRVRADETKQILVDRKLLNQEFVFPEDRQTGLFTASLSRDEAVATRFRLDGGENLILRLINLPDGRKQFVHERYTRNQETADTIADLINPLAAKDTLISGPQRVYVAAHTAERHPDGILFPISIQNDQAWGFSPRPLEAWVEVRPFAAGRPAGNDAQVYHFYDPQFESWTPVPVMKLLAHSWPEDCDQAEVSTTFKYGYTPAKIRRRLDESLGSNGVPHPDLVLELDKGRSVEYVVSIEKLGTGPRGAVVNVLERHLPRTPTLGVARVELQEPAERIHRTWFSEDGLVRHQFTYLTRTAEELRKNNFLSVTLRTDIERDAVRTSRPLKLYVPVK